jgi:hypothetical protein
MPILVAQVHPDELAAWLAQDLLADLLLGVGLALLFAHVEPLPGDDVQGGQALSDLSCPVAALPTTERKAEGDQSHVGHGFPSCSKV